MGLKSFFQKLSGADTTKTGNVFCFVFGADKHFYRRDMEAQGSHLQDNDYRLAHFSSPETTGVLSRVVNGTPRTMGPVSLAYEPIPELWMFPQQNWGPDRTRKAEAGGNGNKPMLFEDDEILDNAWSEAFSLANQRESNQETRNRLLQILLLAVLGVIAMFLLVAVSTGMLDEFVKGAKQFFGG